jgi:hypothetical protein
LKRGALSGVATWRREEATVSQDWFINQTVRLSNYCAIRTVSLSAIRTVLFEEQTLCP